MPSTPSSNPNVSNPDCTSTSIAHEQHLIIDWKCVFDERSMREHIDAIPELRCKHVELVPSLGSNRVSTLSAFYNVHVNDHRGSVPFRLFIVHDLAPTYARRHTTKGYRSVNTHLFDLKKVLRHECRHVKNAQIHATDNIQETKANLRALGLYSTHYQPYTHFQSWSDVFEALNAYESLKWVVTHDFDDLPSPENAMHKDVDFLTNDYYAFMAALDTTECPKGHIMNGVSNGGTSVRGTVKINGIAFPIDVRYVSDGYFDTAFQNMILDTRVPHAIISSLWIPNQVCYNHALLYHALIHKDWKGGASGKYGTLRSMFPSAQTLSDLQHLLLKFMQSHGFAFSQPEPSVGYFPFAY